jgi:hypothetical protein
MQTISGTQYKPNKTQCKPFFSIFLHDAKARHWRLSYLRKSGSRPPWFHSGLELVPPAQTGRSTGHGPSSEAARKISKAP